MIIGISSLLSDKGTLDPYLMVIDTGRTVLRTKVALVEGNKYYSTPYHPIYGDLLEGETVENVRTAIQSFIKDYDIEAHKDEESSPLLQGIDIRFHDFPIEYNLAQEDAVKQISEIKKLKEQV